MQPERANDRSRRRLAPRARNTPRRHELVAPPLRPQTPRGQRPVRLRHSPVRRRTRRMDPPRDRSIAACL